jgi:hypothetical protein
VAEFQGLYKSKISLFCQLHFKKWRSNGHRAARPVSPGCSHSCHCMALSNLDPLVRPRPHNHIQDIFDEKIHMFDMGSKNELVIHVMSSTTVQSVIVKEKKGSQANSPWTGKSKRQVQGPNAVLSFSHASCYRHKKGKRYCIIT